MGIRHTFVGSPCLPANGVVQLPIGWARPGCDCPDTQGSAVEVTAKASPTATLAPTDARYPTYTAEPTETPTIPPPPPPPTIPTATPAPYPTVTPPQPSLTPVPPTPTIALTEAQVVEVVDGDTIKVDIDGKEYTVRYIGIDCPETKDPNKGVEWMGPEATEGKHV
jgi:hypothetical protein